MRTIDTLNLPATTSGTWRLPDPVPAVQSLPAAVLAPGLAVALQAPAAIAATANRLTSRSRVLAIDLLLTARTCARTALSDIARAPLRHARARATLRVPGTTRSGRKDSLRTNPSERRPTGISGIVLYHPGDVRTNGAASGAARDQRQASGRTFGLHRGVRPGRFAPGNARAGRRGPFHGAHHLQGHEAVPLDPGDLRGDRGRRRLLQRCDGPGVARLLGPRPAARTGHSARL